jgi:hypothetical protein
MNQKHLLRFIKKKLRTVPHEIVAKKDGNDLTLAQVGEWPMPRHCGRRIQSNRANGSVPSQCV